MIDDQQCFAQKTNCREFGIVRLWNNRVYALQLVGKLPCIDSQPWNNASTAIQHTRPRKLIARLYRSILLSNPKTFGFYTGLPREATGSAPDLLAEIVRPFVHNDMSACRRKISLVSSTYWRQNLFADALTRSLTWGRLEQFQQENERNRHERV